ncbi:hypothetical protein ACGGZK_18585 [Agromyces sp. MMS24-K17]|uniref:hypothetical protein n=1 Tax=Agromyces sp. MMS24-K17 TaxID=3372850 RepID=UPI0037552917
MSTAPGTRRWTRATIATSAAGGVLALSGCVAVTDDGTRLSDWTTSVGAGWDRFVTEVLAPVGNALFAILVAWLALAVVARLITLIPGIRNLRMARRTGAVLRAIGWTLLVLTPIITVLTTAFAEDNFFTWLIVSTPLAYAAVGTLGVGLATRSRLDAKVITTDGEANEAWSIDALLQVRKVYSEELRGHMQQSGSADLSEFITLADRSGSGIASAIAWVVQVLFNATPWLLQVTILDGRSAVATMRRNGVAIGERELDLAWGDADADQHRRLLAFAAVFAAAEMESRYRDGRGFDRSEGWEAVAMRRLARSAKGDERGHYLARAGVAATPTGRWRR